MVQSAVVAFRIILNRHLPVTIFRYLYPLQWPQAVYLRNMSRQLCTDARKPLIHWLRLRVQIDKQEATEIFGRHFCQTNIFPVEPVHSLHVWGAPQTAVKFVGPGVIGTGNQACIAASRDKLVRAMLAYIVEGADPAVSAHHAEQRLAGHLESEIIAWFLKLRRVSGKLPARGEQATGLDLEYCRVGVIASIKRKDGTGIVGHAD